MRNVCEHGIARAAHAFELRLVANDLHLQLIDRRGARDDRRARRIALQLETFARERAAFGARTQDRTTRLARSLTVFWARFQHITAKSTDRIARLYAKQTRRLRIQVANDPRLIDGIHPFDDA